MKGEIGLKIKEIKIDGFNENIQDLTIIEDSGDFFHVCGDNNIEKLLIEALIKFKSEFKGELIERGELLKRYLTPEKMYQDLPFKDPYYFMTRIQGVMMTVDQAMSYLENRYDLKEEVTYEIL